MEGSIFSLMLDGSTKVIALASAIGQIDYVLWEVENGGKLYCRQVVCNFSLSWREDIEKKLSLILSALSCV